jgi:peptide/nickel transport system substrate-binding protein
MHMKKPLVAMGLVGLMALAACGSSGGGTNNNANPSSGGSAATDSASDIGKLGTDQDPTAKGPVVIDGATKGGTVTVLTDKYLTTTIDPSEAYYVDSGSILTGLITRSLTQYKYDPSTKQMVLVPDLATDLGHHNKDYTQWSFTIRSGVKWQDGSPVTAQQVAFGIDRSFDRQTFPTGASYSNDYFLGGDTYKGPYTDPKGKDQAVSVSGNTITIKMSQPFPDMPYWGSFPAMGAIPTDPKINNPKTYKLKPWSDGPYMVKSYALGKELTLVRNPNWDPNTDPARTQYPDEYDFKAGADSQQTDQILLADTGQGQTTLTIDDLLSPDYTKMKQTNPSQLTLGGSPCTYYAAPDNRTITDINVRRALGLAFPYKDVILASGDIPGVTAIPAGSLMPPGTPGQTDYNPTGEPAGTTDTAKAKQLLTAAGKLGYKITYLYRTDSPIWKQIQQVLDASLKKAGFTTNPIGETSDQFYADLADANGPENFRYGTGWCSDWPSGSSWFPPVLQSTDLKNVGLASNYAAFSNKDVDAQIKKIELMPADQQPEAWGKLDQDISQKYYPLITTYYTGVAQAHGSAIQGDNDDTVYGMPTWKDIWVKQ